VLTCSLGPDPGWATKWVLFVVAECCSMRAIVESKCLIFAKNATSKRTVTMTMDRSAGTRVCRRRRPLRRLPFDSLLRNRKKYWEGTSLGNNNAWKMRNYFAPSRARRRSSRSPSPTSNASHPPPPRAATSAVGGRDDGEADAEAPHAVIQSQAASALRIRNANNSHHHHHPLHDSTAATKSPGYVIRPLPWMSPSMSAANGATIDPTMSSYLFGGHYSRTAAARHQQHSGGRMFAQHPRVRRSSSTSLRYCRNVPPKVVGTVTACAAVALMYKVLTWIAVALFSSSSTINYGRDSFRSLEVLQFREWRNGDIAAVSATIDLERDIEQVHRLELLRRQNAKDPAFAARNALDLALSSSYGERRRQVLERIVPKWLHRNDAKPPHEVDSGGNEEEEEEDSEAGAGEVGTNDGEARKLETETTMITLDNMDRHRGNSCPSNEKSIGRDIRTTLVIQASPDRMWILNETCRRWKDPIVVVLGVVASSATDTADGPASWNNATATSLQQSCPQLTLLKQDIPSDPVLYPVNALRNAALDAVQTSHVLVMDADFVPSTHLDEQIRTVLRAQQLQQKRKDNSEFDNDDNSNDYLALVVPAFERVDKPPCPTPDECMSHLLRNSSYIPQTFEELQLCVVDKNCQVFQHDNNWPGHYSTRSDEWLQRQWYDGTNGTAARQLPNASSLDVSSLRIRQVPCFHSLRYEPYVVIAWCGTGGDRIRHQQPRAPYYDERFHGYGKNKIEHLQHLRLLGYRFEILPDGFIVHNPHVDSRAKLDWNAHRSSLHHDMDRLYPQFLKELLEHPSLQHSRRIVGLCPKEEKKGGSHRAAR
jgi:Glycosyl-transferase for dystroglycan